jgi:hypothetical protein
MMIASAQEFAHALNKELRLNLTPRPWNWYKPVDTYYYLVPSANWPAYKYSKFVFATGTDYPRKLLLGINDSTIHTDKLLAGFYIEKGFGEDAAIVDSNIKQKQQVKDPTWAWESFIRQDSVTRFARTLARISDREELHLYVLSSYVHDREDERRPPHDAIVFSCQRDELRPVINNRYPVGVLYGLDDARDFDSLAARLRTIDDYHWIDMYVVAYVEGGDVDLRNLYANVLSFFQPWIDAT